MLLLEEIFESIIGRHPAESDEAGHLIAQRLKELEELPESQANSLTDGNTDAVGTPQAHEAILGAAK